jgi:outer membrane protein assembly factor BamE (lipoprotein component of BamABCDE complex)
MIAKGRYGTAAFACASLAVLAGVSGCARTRGHQGYVMDNALVASVQPGVDNRDSVLKTLGDPSFAGEFDPSTWYYVSRTTRQFSFGLPKPIAETALAIHFDPRGNVTGVERTGLERVVPIAPVGDKTATLGRKRGLIQELFGNIGSVGGVGTNAPTADNPNGKTGP